MTKTAAVAFEVRWRKNVDPANQWSTPVSVGADGHVKVPGLERVTDYTFEARAISGCGAKSSWATQTLALPDAPADTLTLTDIASEVTAAQNSADNANNQLALIASDSQLSPPEKPTVERDYSVITTEQAGIDAQATAYGITTEKTAYDAAITALTTYLGTLTTATAWNDKSGNTTIVGTTFRAKFNTVYTTRQTLLNAIYAAAKAKADAAQSTANTASDTANTALANGDQATIINPQFNGWGANGSLHGWTSDQGTWVHQSGTNGPLSGTSSYAIRTGSATSSDAIRNAGRFPVYPGAVIKASCLIRGTGSPNGSCQVRVSWRDASDSELSVTHGSAVTGNVTATSSVSATAPAGAVIAHIEADAIGHTTGSYAVDNFTASSTADSMDQVPDGASRFASIFGAATQAGIYQPGANLIPNPSAALGSLGWTVSGFATVPASQDTNGPYWITSTNSGDLVSGTFKMSSGQSIVLSADLFTGSLASGQLIGVCPCFSASGTFLGQPEIILGAKTTWRRYASAAFAVPTGTDHCYVRFFLNGATNSATGVRRIKLEVGTVATPYSDEATQFGNQLTEPGSGRKLGDQRNAPSSLTRNLGIVRSATALTARAGGAVDINAHTITMGSATIGYNALSNAVTGLTTGSSYYIYTRDNYAGGSPTWGYSTDSS